jgi:hypothetical protein
MAHEDLLRDTPLEGSSDRTFGFVFAAFFLIIAAWPLLRGVPMRWWAFAIALVFAAVAIAQPARLAPLNRAWMRLGVLLGKVISPIALGIVFFGVLTPTAVLMRWRGKDPLRLARAPSAPSYWLPREPPGPPPQSMTHQF